MNLDKKLIKEIISSDLKPISNPDFTYSTLEKIKKVKETNVNTGTSFDLNLIYPAVALSIIVMLYSIIIVFNSWIKTDQIDKAIKMVLSFSFHPVTISIIISFTLLYFTDLQLKKHTEKLAPKKN